MKGMLRRSKISWGSGDSHQLVMLNANCSHSHGAFFLEMRCM